MSVSSLLACLPFPQVTPSKILFDAYRRTQSDRSIIDVFDPIREGILEENSNAKELNLKASNGEMVNGIHFEGTEDKAIIWLHGNGCFYETSFDKPLQWQEELRRDHQLPHLIVFNPRGTGKSEGRTQLSYVIEDLTLFFEHIKPRTVVIGGHSMGGYFTLFGAAELQKRYPETNINFISDRSIWSLRSRVSTKLDSAGYSGISKSIMSFYLETLMTSPDWSRDSLQALETLKGRVLIIFHKKDGVVLLNDSTYYGLSMAKKTRDYEFLELMDNDSTEFGAHPHNRGFSEEESTNIISKIRSMLEIDS